MKAKPAKPCNSDCEVAVGVETPSIFSSYLTVGENFVTVGKGKKPKITWKLSAKEPKYQLDFGFDPYNGIDFGEDKSEFDCAFETNTIYNCKVKHQNGDLTAYKYTINVKVLKGLHGTPAPLDPWVIAE